MDGADHTSQATGRESWTVRTDVAKEKILRELLFLTSRWSSVKEREKSQGAE